MDTYGERARMPMHIYWVSIHKIFELKILVKVLWKYVMQLRLKEMSNQTLME